MNTKPIGLTVRQAVEANGNTLLEHEGVIFSKYLLPFFLPHLCTIDHERGVETWRGLPCNTSIQLATPQQIKKYVSANTKA